MLIPNCKKSINLRINVVLLNGIKRWLTSKAKLCIKTAGHKAHVKISIIIDIIIKLLNSYCFIKKLLSKGFTTIKN